MSLSAGFFNLKSSSHAIALETTIALIIPIQPISVWQRKYKSWNKFIIQVYKQRYEELLIKYKHLAFNNVDERILDYLQTHASVHPQKNVNISHQQLANQLGTTRVLVSRILKQHELNGKIKLYRGTIKVI